MSRQVIYLPPNKDDVRTYARAVCEALAKSKDDESYLDPHVVDGFTRFMEVTCQIAANHRNRGNEIA